MLNRVILSMFAISVFVSGCATPEPSTRAQITYDTKPEGATLYENGVKLGVAPQTRQYQALNGSKTITTPDIVAVWASGAKASYFTYLKVGDDVDAEISRPSGVPGLDQDEEIAKPLFANKAAAKVAAKEQALKDQIRDSDGCKRQRALQLGLDPNC